MPIKEYFTIYKNGEIFKEHKNISESHPYFLTAAESQYKEDDIFTIKLKYDWNGQMAGRDMTFSIYSKQNLSIKDKNGFTNMLHYDGNEPSGFTESKYSVSLDKIAFSAEGTRK